MPSGDNWVLKENKASAVFITFEALLSVTFGVGNDVELKLVSEKAAQMISKSTIGEFSEGLNA